MDACEEHAGGEGSCPLFLDAEHLLEVGELAVSQNLSAVEDDFLDVVESVRVGAEDLLVNQVLVEQLGATLLLLREEQEVLLQVLLHVPLAQQVSRLLQRLLYSP